MKTTWSHILCYQNFLHLITYAIILIALCSKMQSQNLAPLDPPVTVNVATDFSASDAAYYIAYSRGYFAELGLQIKFTQFPSSTEMLPMLAIDQIQVAGGITSTSFFNAIDRGVGIRFLADQGHNLPGRPFDTLVLRSGLLKEVKTIQNLRGKKIGLASIQSLNEYKLEVILNSAGLSVRDIQIVVMESFPNITLALMNGAIDAAMHLEPFLTIGQEKGFFRQFVDLSRVAPQAQLSIMLGSQKFTEQVHVSGRFLVAYLRGVRDYVDTFIHGKKDESIYQILTKYTDLKDVNLWKKVSVPGLNPNGYFFKESLERQLKWYKKKGYYKGNLNVEKVTDYRPVDFAIHHLGRYDNYPLKFE